MNELIDQLNDPTKCHSALTTLIATGKEAVPFLAGFLRSSKPSSLPEARLLAVEGLRILRGALALEVLMEVSSYELARIVDPAVRLGEETVVSRAALALAEFQNANAHEALLQLAKGKPLAGVAVAYTRIRDPRALPYLVKWLEDDYCSEVSMHAIRGYGRAAAPALLGSLRQVTSRFGRETRLSARRRARILDLLAEIIRRHELQHLIPLLDDPAECVRLNAARAVLRAGDQIQQQRAYQTALGLLDSFERSLRAEAEETLAAHLEIGIQLLEEEILKHRAAGESESQWFPRESALAILIRLYKKRNQHQEALP